MKNESKGGPCIVQRTFEETELLTEGKCFKVEYKKLITERIVSKYFLKRRDDRKQEMIRKIIYESLEKMLGHTGSKMWRNPNSYFYLLIPEKKWIYGDKEYVTVKEMMNFAGKVGGSIIRDIEEASAWGQQIVNGCGSNESWDALCNNIDSIKLSRLTLWENFPAIFGGVGHSHSELYSYYGIRDNTIIKDTVPSVKLASLNLPTGV